MLLVPRLHTLMVSADGDGMQGYVSVHFLRAMTVAYASFSLGVHFRV